MDIIDYYDFTIRLARKAGMILLQNYRGDFKVDFKGGQKNNLVTEVDRKSEKFLVDAIKKKFPDHCFLSEESGDCAIAKSACRWIIDPIDGTTNYAHGHPFFCISIALEIDGKIVLGVIYAPKLDELFRAAVGHGAYLNNETIKVSSVKKLESALLATGFPPRARERNLPFFQKIIPKSQGIRRAGSAALDLAYVACGRLDGYWEFSLCPWDIAAGKLLITEAGGKISAVDGGPFELEGDNLLASNGHIHNELARELKAD